MIAATKAAKNQFINILNCPLLQRIDTAIDSSVVFLLGENVGL